MLRFTDSFELKFIKFTLGGLTRPPFLLYSQPMNRNSKIVFEEITSTQNQLAQLWADNRKKEVYNGASDSVIEALDNAIAIYARVHWPHSQPTQQTFINLCKWG